MKAAIIFSTENKANTKHVDVSTSYEKMAIGLAYSIRQHMPDIDVYCGNFTNNELSVSAKLWFRKLKVNLVREFIFDDIGTPQSYMFLRSFTNHYFATTLLDQYDYLIYLDIDVVVLKPLVFDFDPTSNMVLVERVPQWVKNYHANHLQHYQDPVYYNWLGIVNRHNAFVFDLDYQALVTSEHTPDVLVSKNINESNLLIIDQTIGGYHCLKPVTPDSLLYHYDSLGKAGSLCNLESTHPTEYKKYMNFFQQTLRVQVDNQKNFWEDIAEEYK